jgi:Ca2+/Na+ antiporter
MVVAAVLGAFAGAAALVLFYAFKPGVVLDMGTDLPPVARGFYPIERAPDGLTFAWTRDRAELHLPGLDRRSPWTATVRFRGARPAGVRQPEVWLAVDGRIDGRRDASNAWEELSVTVPASTANDRGVLLTLQASSTFVPGPGDPRQLGVVVDEIRLVPATSVVALPPRRTIGGAMISAGLFGLAVAAIGLTTVSAVAASVVVALGQGAAMARGLGPYLPYGGDLAWWALAIASLLVLSVLAIERGARLRFRNTARFAAIFAAAALYLELAVLLHPSMPIGDGLFHAHRFEWVLSGRYFFTSVAPGGYQFPYAIGLYVAAAPFAAVVHGVAAYVDLLRTMVAVAATLAGLLAYPIVVRAYGDRLAAAIAAALVHLVPMHFQVQVTGNLTNAFGQSLFFVTLALVALGVVRERHLRGTMVAAAVALGAALSHTSTFAILVATLLLAAAVFLWRGGPQLRGSWRAIATVAACAAVAAIAVYYAHFLDTYREQFSRIGGELGRPAAESDPGGRSLTDRMALVPYNLLTYYGAPVIALAMAGGAWLWRQPRHTRLSLTLAGWAGACVVFLGLGVLTPVDLRYYLAFSPALAILAGLGASWLWQGGAAGRAMAGTLLALAVARAVWEWLRPLAGGGN